MWSNSIKPFWTGFQDLTNRFDVAASRRFESNAIEVARIAGEFDHAPLCVSIQLTSTGNVETQKVLTSFEFLMFQIEKPLVYTNGFLPIGIG